MLAAVRAISKDKVQAVIRDIFLRIRVANMYGW